MSMKLSLLFLLSVALCQNLMSDLTTLASSLSENDRLEMLSTFLKRSTSTVEIARNVVRDVARSSSITVRDKRDLLDCEELMGYAKDQMVKSVEEFQGGNLNLAAYENVHTWLGGVLTSYEMCLNGITSEVSKRRVEPQVHELISKTKVALAIFLSISPVRDDVELEMVVPDDFPARMSDSDNQLLDSTDPEALKKKADLIVAKDGSGDFKTVKEAIAAIPVNRTARYVVYVKTGVYNETIFIDRTKTNLTLIGDGQDKTILTGNLSDKDGFSIKNSSTLATEAVGFMAQDMCFENTAGPEKGQAVALRVSGDMSVIYRCRILGYQDTLLADRERQFYRECFISGTVDFIFGAARAVFQKCIIEARKPKIGQGNVITAQARDNPGQLSGFSIHKCNITASPDLTPDVKTFLGRPWKTYSTVVVMESFLGDLIDPAGWDWDGETGRLSTLFYGEYGNLGPGANTSNRVTWKGFRVLTDPKEAQNYTVANLIDGPMWLNSTGVPYDGGL